MSSNKPEKNKKTKKKSNKKKIFLLIAQIFAFLSVIAVGISIYFFVTIRTSVQDLLIEPYSPIEPSIIYDINGNQFDIIKIENRDPIKLTEVPPHVQNAFLAIEDRKFMEHHGFDFPRLGKAVFLNLTGKGREGGSTITQQLVKNAYLTPERSVMRKAKEAVIALELERTYTKQEILENYLNTINFGKGAYGIKNASIKYFNKQPKDLSIAQAAILASMPKSPSKYSKLENAIERQKQVLEQMRKYEFITEQEYLAAKSETIAFVNGNIDNRNEEEEISTMNNAPEFTTIVISEVKKILEEKYGKKENEGFMFDGYKIYATIDLDMQRAAYKAFENNSNLRRNSELEGALISIDPTNGYVKAMVGGKNYQKGNFNRALNGLRQPGSSYKPFVYLAGVQSGIPMNSVIEDSPMNVDGWKPNNYDRKFRDGMTVLRALEISNNIVPVKILNRVGVPSVKKIWNDSGITEGDFPEGLALALGSITTTPIDMATAYMPLANGGFKVSPVFIYKIENKYGEVIYEAPRTREKIFAPEDVALVTHMLQSAVKFGTGQAAKIFKGGKAVPVAGKTGTTSDYISAWFTGYTPNLVTVVYVGFDDNKSMRYGMTGGAAAIPIWKNYMQAVVNIDGYNVGDFDFITDNVKRKDLVFRDIDLKTGLLDTDGVDKRTALFKAGTEPVEYETKFRNGVPGF